MPYPQPRSSPQNSPEASFLSQFISLSEGVLWLRGCSARRDTQEVSGNGCPRNVPHPVMGEPMDKHPASSSTMEKARDCHSVSQMPGGPRESHLPCRAASLALSPSLLASPLPPKAFWECIPNISVQPISLSRGLHFGELKPSHQLKASHSETQGGPPSSPM